MFERFTDRARRVLVLAQEEARLLNHQYIGTEHLLLGLIHEGEGVAADALTICGLTLEAVRDRIESNIGAADKPTTGSPPFTPRCKKVLELSLREALQFGHNYIGTEHILLGLIREGEGVAAKTLIELGADLPHVRQVVIGILSGYQAVKVAAEAADARREIGGLVQAVAERAKELPLLDDDNVIAASRHLYGVLAAVDDDDRALTGRRMLARERRRQVVAEGFTLGHDDTHCDGDLGMAARCYLAADEHAPVPPDWPWDEDFWNPKDRISNLVRAGALFMAEVERAERRSATLGKLIVVDPLVPFTIAGIADEIDRLRTDA